MSEKEDEITVDLSKVGSFFKGIGKKSKEATQDHHVSVKPRRTNTSQDTHGHSATPQKQKGPQDSGEVSIDLRKIGSVFRREEAKSETKTTSDEVSINLQSLKPALQFIDKNKVFLLLLIPIILSIYIRIQPAYLPITDTWAHDSVYRYYQNSILAQVNQQYPNLPDANKIQIVNDEFNKVLKDQGALIDQQIAQTSLAFKQQFQDDKGQSYLSAIDSEYWIRFVENIVKNGHPGDTLVDGKPYDTHFLAPTGRFVPLDGQGHIWFEYYWFRFLQFFDPGMYPVKAAFYVPILLSALSIIPAFFIARRVGGDVGGLFAAMLIAIHTSFVSRTMGGIADTDGWVVLYPLLITWLMLEAFESRDIKKTIGLTFVSGVLAGLFSFTWLGWWYIFDFILGAVGLYLVYYLVSNRFQFNEKTKPQLVQIAVLVIVFFASTDVFVTALTNNYNFVNAVMGPFSFMRIKEVAGGTLWPNVYTTVAEQSELDFEGIITNAGGRIIFAAALLGIALVIILAIINRDKHDKIDLKYALLLSIWVAATVYASFKGVRFVLLMVPAISIAFGVFVGIVVNFASEYASSELKVRKVYATLVLVFMCLALILTQFSQAMQISTHEVTNMNDAWVRSLTLIKTNSTQDAIINSWWDFGHWFKYWADRGVTFDGTSQTGSMAHFMGRVLLTDNEDEAVSILRMADCGQDSSFAEIEKINKDSLESIQLLKQVILLDRQKARALLVKHLGDAQAEVVLNLTHCSPPEDYFITSEDMVGKSGVWAHFGSWNFTKADMVWHVRATELAQGTAILEERYGFSPEEADRMYYDIQTQDANNWIAPWPSYDMSQQGRANIISCTKDKDIISCGNGLMLNLTSGDASVKSSQGIMHPSRVSYIANDGTFTVRNYNTSLINGGNNQALGAAIFPYNDQYATLSMTRELTASMFTRLFFFKGYGLSHFKLFHYERDITGQDIFVWKVDWLGNQTKSA